MFRYCLLIVIVILNCISSSAQQLVMPGDYPDPSVVKIGDTYWASATTSNWAPAYPLLSSKDLVNWETKSHVFDKLPGWADYYFWAPEITYDNDKVYVYYAAHKRNGNLCLSVASADRPEGPYQDLGPLMCEPAGSIDAFPMRDENGTLCMIWKEDGNSVNKPTPIWAMQMSEDRRELIGEKIELFRNDAQWEGNLVEGVSMLKHGDYIYAFYAGAGCCGRACTYGVGVARAKSLLGPWEKYNMNPILTPSQEWKCPGHGTPIEKDGRFYFLYHAYHVKGDVYAGRQGVLSEFKFTSDGWVEFLPAPKGSNVKPPQIQDDFSGSSLHQHWQWSVFEPLNYQLRNGSLRLNALPTKSGQFIGQKTYSPKYETRVTVLPGDSNAEAGLALIGDEKNFIALTYNHGKLTLRKVENEKETIIGEKQVAGKENIVLKFKVENGKDITATYSVDGKKFRSLSKEKLDGFFLPPWDRAVRVGLTSKGEQSQYALFDNFRLQSY